MLARLYDILILTIVLIIFITIFNIETSFPADRGMYWQIIYLSYIILLPLFWHGYVMGKKIGNIKVESLHGERLTLKNMVTREFIGFYLIGILSLGIAYMVSMIMIAVREDGKGLHDLIGGTSVTEVN
ncbi:RDD family protein [Virgibacillus oceani]